MNWQKGVQRKSTLDGSDSVVGAYPTQMDDILRIPVFILRLNILEGTPNPWRIQDIPRGWGEGVVVGTPTYYEKGFNLSSFDQTMPENIFPKYLMTSVLNGPWLLKNKNDYLSKPLVLFRCSQKHSLQGLLWTLKFQRCHTRRIE